MIHDVDVVMQMPTRTIGVRYDKKVCTVHALGKLHPEIMHTLDVLRIIHIELLRGEVLRVGVHLVKAMERSTHLFRTCNDHLLSTCNGRLWRLHRARVPSSTIGAILKVLPTTLTCTVQRVFHC